MQARIRKAAIKTMPKSPVSQIVGSLRPTAVNAILAEAAVAEATGQVDVAVGAAMNSSILDVAGLDSERITQAAGDVAGQELGTLTGIKPPPLAGLAGLIKIVIIIP